MPTRVRLSHDPIFDVMKKSKNRGFTLIELLTVIAIIGILAAIIIPTVSSVRTSANKSKTRVQFSQWSAATELFKQEYGFYPRLTSGATLGSGALDTTTFIVNLTAKTYNGGTPSDFKDNRKRLSFYSVADSDLLKDGSGAITNQLVDAFGNANINVMIDANGDGMISGGERVTGSLDGGNSIDGTTTNSSSPTIPADIRAGVALYSPGKATSANDYVYSW